MMKVINRTIWISLLLGVYFLTAAGLVGAQSYGDVQAPAQRAGQASVEREKDPFPDEMSIEEYQAIMNAQFQVEVSSTYTLGVNDVLEVTVLRHPEVSGQYIINSEGKIQYEFVGDIEVAGLTKDGLKEVLVENLSTYIVSPEVTIKIIGYNSKIVYVYGEVASPGKIFMRGDTITVREALLEAGLPLLTASTKKGSLMTPSAEGKIVKKPVNVQALLYEGDLRENHVMNPGDTLYIPPTFMAKTMRAIQPIAQPIGTAAGTGRTLRGGF